MSKVLSDIGKQKVLEIFARQNLATTMGASILRMGHGEVEIKLPKHPLGLQHHDYFHGGIIGYLADISGGLAAATLLIHPSHSLLTVQMKINFLSPGSGDFLLGKGKVIKENKGLIIATAQIFSNEQMVAYMVQTVKRMIPRQK